MAQLLSNLPNGSLIKFGKHQVGSEMAQSIIWTVVDKNHSGYPANSTTLITHKIIDLRAFDAKGKTSDGSSYSENDYYPASNIHQWLNSDASANNWFTPYNTDDNPPSNEYISYNTGYQSRSGFLFNFSQEERLALLPTTLKFPSAGLDPYHSITAKVFIPSIKEILGSPDVGDDTTRLDYFKLGSVQCGLTYQAYINTESTSKPSTVDDNWKYMTRSSTNSSSNYLVNSTGSYDKYDRVYNGNQGVRPIINLSSSLKISDTTDSDGCYTIAFNHSPIISDIDADLGVKNDGFGQKYTITDEDNENVTVTEYIDNVVLRSYVVTLDTENTFDVTGKTWLTLANGNHTLKIVATDGVEEVTRTYTFVKSIASLMVQRTTPISASTKPTNIIVTVVKNIPYNATMKVEACNNGFDTNPTWEDITDSVTSGLTHVFSNATKTASQWGVNIRVTVDRNGAEGACYITEIGGNFE